MANDTCPHCGAERRYNERYDCGTWLAGVVGNNEVRAGICWDRQLATVTAERDRHLEIIKACRNGFNNLEPHGKTILDFMNVWLDQSNERAERAEHERDELRRRLDEAGECIDQFCGAVWAYGSKSERDELEKLTRLVRDDQPEEAVT